MAAQALPVPYSGATQSVHLGTQELFAGQLSLFDVAEDAHVGITIVDGELFVDGNQIPRFLQLESRYVPYNAAIQDVNLGSLKLQAGAPANTPIAGSIHGVATTTAGQASVFDGMSGQTGDLTRWRDSTGTILAKVSSAGNVTSRSHTIGTNVSAPRIYTHSGNSVAETANSPGLTLYGVAGASNNEYRFQHYTTNSTLTGGHFVNTRIQTGVAPTSGTGTITQLQIDPTINQTGGANGITRGIHITPTLTAAADWRSFQSSNNTGYAFYGEGTAPSQFNGDVVSAALMCAGAYTVGTLPSASANAGKFCQVTDSSVTTFGSTVAGGGSNRRQVFSDGTNWIIH